MTQGELFPNPRAGRRTHRAAAMMRAQVEAWREAGSHVDDAAALLLVDAARALDAADNDYRVGALTAVQWARVRESCQAAYLDLRPDGAGEPADPFDQALAELAANDERERGRADRGTG